MATTENGIYYPNDYNSAADIPADMKKMAESIDKNIQDNKYDDSNIKQDIQDLQTNVSDIKKEQLTQNDLIERLKDNQINITTEQSNNINVQDCSNLPAKIGVFGISEQKTRSGKNKFDIEKLTSNNITEKDSKTGTFTMSNCWGNTIMNNVSLQKLLKPNTQYKCIADITLLSKPSDLNSSNSSQILSLYNNQGVVVVNMLLTSTKQEKDNWEVNSTKHLSTTFTTPSDLTGFNMLAYNYRTERATNEGSFKIEKIMILDATEEDESFEQYGASPSPEYPSEIENVEGNVDITVCNKNLYDGKIVNVASDGEKTVFASNYISTFIKSIPGKSYSISKKVQTSRFRVAFSKEIPNVENIPLLNGYMGTEFDNKLKIENMVAPIETNYMLVYLSNSSENINNIGLQIEENSIATDIIPHEEQTITFPLQEGQKLYEGDYLADDGIHHVRKQVELDGTEDWIFYASSVIQFGLTISNMKFPTLQSEVLEALSNQYKSSAWSRIGQSEEHYLMASPSLNGTNEILRIKNTDYTDLSSFKNYLAQQKEAGTPVIVEYELVEEEIEPYTEEQQEVYNKLQNILPYKLVTNIFTDLALLKFNYIADTKTYIDNKTTNIQNQLNTINQLLSTTATSALLLNNMQTDLESEVV